MNLRTETELRTVVERELRETPVTDIHTHLYPPAFGTMLPWGLDDLLVYHYLVAETFRRVDLPVAEFWAMPKRRQADLVWRTLFIENTPISESCRGVLTVLNRMGLHTASRDLESYRRHYGTLHAATCTDSVLRIANVRTVVMTNDPFDETERAIWLERGQADPRFKAALRIDALLNGWNEACPQLRQWGYDAEASLTPATLNEVRRFLADWAARTSALYLAASFPPDFRMPEGSPRATLIAECVLPVCRALGKPFAMMIGVKKQVNPQLQLAGDGVGRAAVETVEHLCAAFPANKFLVTMLSRENQHELCVAARKFRNLMIFGCWWFLNTPSLVDEITRMRLELLGTSFVAQHSDARVLDQLIYKWDHARAVIGEALCSKYRDVVSTGWTVSEDEIRRDVAGLLGGTFWKFLGERR